MAKKRRQAWTLEFDTGESTDERWAAFRNNSTDGTGAYLQVTENLVNENYVYFMGYMTMSDAYTGSDQFPANSDQKSIAKSAGIGPAYSGVPHPWMIIADDRCFYFFSWFWADARETWPPESYNFRNTLAMFFGDIEPLIPGDSYAAALICDTASYAGFLSLVTTPNVGAGLVFVPRYSAGAVPGESETPGLHQITTGPLTGYSGAIGLDYPFSGQMVIARPYLNDGTTYTMRGYLPGYYTPCHNTLLWRDEIITEIAQDNMTFLGITHGIHSGAYNYESQSLIRIDEGFRA